MKLYDLSYSYFLPIFVKFQRGFFEVSKSRNLVAVGLNWGTTLSGPQVVANNHFDFFFLFFLVCRLIHPVPLVK